MSDNHTPDTNCYLPPESEIAAAMARLRAAHLERKLLADPPSDKVGLREAYQVKHWPDGRG